MAENTEVIDVRPVRRKIYKMIIPITGESVLSLSTSLISMAMIGRISPIAVNSIGIASRITQMIWALFKGITTGAAVFVAQAHGAGNKKKLKTVVQQTLLSIVAFVMILQQVVFWNAQALLSIFNPEPKLMESAVVYLKYVSWGLPFMAIMLVVASVLQGTGNSHTPMFIALAMNMFNILFSFGLIFGNMGFPAWGLKGAAIATVIAQFIGAVIGLCILFRRKGILGSMFNKDFFKINKGEIVAVYKVGLPTSFESIFWQVAAIILTRVILTFGEIPFAAHQLGLQAESISYMPAAGFGIAATAFIGQALGAKDKELAKTYLKEIRKGAFWVTLFCSSLLVFFPGVIMGALTSYGDVAALGAKYLIIMGLVQMPQNISGVLNGALRGAGFTRVPMYVAGIGLWGVRVPLTLLFTYYFKTTIVAIWIIMGVDLIVRFCISFGIYKVKDIYNTELVIDK